MDEASLEYIKNSHSHSLTRNVVFQEMLKLKDCLNTYSGIIDTDGLLRPYVCGKEKEAAINPHTMIKSSSSSKLVRTEADGFADLEDEPSINHCK